MEEIKGYNKDVDFQNLYDHDEFEEALKKHQIKKAKQEVQKEMMQSLYQNGISIELIAQSTKKSIEEVKEILNIE